MGNFTFIACGGMEGLYEVQPKIYRDARGYNMEAYAQKAFFDAGLDMVFVQANCSVSQRGVLRGMHFQRNYQQGKLVRVVRGEVFDAVVDLREGSSTYGKWFGIVLSSEKKNMLYVPEGFAHGFLVLSKEAEFSYMLSDFYHPEDESGIPWNDADVGIAWPIEEDMEIIVSDRDNTHPSFAETSPLLPKKIKATV